MSKTSEQQQQKDGRVATVGLSVSIKGEICGSEDVTVDGQVEGRIELPGHTLTIGPNATVLADINARIVIILGTVVGTVIARETAEIRKTASVEGSLACGRLAVQDGATINGKIETMSQPAADRSKTGKVA
jgi:cytoskeletal protein CcmA (bactofilin family)